MRVTKGEARCSEPTHTNAILVDCASVAISYEKNGIERLARVLANAKLVWTVWACSDKRVRVTRIVHHLGLSFLEVNLGLDHTRAPRNCRQVFRCAPSALVEVHLIARAMIETPVSS